MNKGAPGRKRHWVHLLWGVGIACLAPPGLAADEAWPQDPPIPVMKPSQAHTLIGAESLRLDTLLLASTASAAPTAATALASSASGAATVAIEPAAAAEARMAEEALLQAQSPLPIPKPIAAHAIVLTRADTDAAPSPRVELLPPSSLATSLAAIEASAASGGPSQSSVFAPPPLTTNIVVSLDSNAFRFALPKAGDMSFVPSLEMVGLPPVDPNLVRMSAPHDPRVTPTPGLDATMSFGDVTLDAKVNQPLRAVETKTSPDTRPLADRSNFGVDMKLKF